jgi:hypothetical protein
MDSVLTQQPLARFLQERVESIGCYGRHDSYFLSRKQDMSLVGFWCVRKKYYALPS